MILVEVFGLSTCIPLLLSNGLFHLRTLCFVYHFRLLVKLADEVRVVHSIWLEPALEVLLTELKLIHSELCFFWSLILIY